MKKNLSSIFSKSSNLTNKIKVLDLLKTLSSKKGFTLIELLVVIAIVGVLAATLLVIINPGQRIASARNARVKADLANIGTAANVFSADTGLGAGCTATYPADFSFTGPGCSSPVTFMPVLLDPSGSPYDVETNGACTPSNPCTSVAIEGPAYADGVTSAGFWCWRSATGTVVLVMSDAACTF